MHNEIFFFLGVVTVKVGEKGDESETRCIGARRRTKVETAPRQSPGSGASADFSLSARAMDFCS